MKKYSILGFALFTVAAITSAFIPSKSNASVQKDPGQGGDLVPSTGGLDDTCTAGGLGNQCDYTVTGGAVDSDGFSATAIATNLTVSHVQAGDNDTNDAGSDPLTVRSISTTLL